MESKQTSKRSYKSSKKTSVASKSKVIKLFDLKKINDLPEQIQDCLKEKKVMKKMSQDTLFPLFELEHFLNAKQIMVAFYREYNIIEGLSKVENYLSRLENIGIIQSEIHHNEKVYSLCKKYQLSK